MSFRSSGRIDGHPRAGLGRRHAGLGSASRSPLAVSAGGLRTPAGTSNHAQGALCVPLRNA